MAGSWRVVAQTPRTKVDQGGNVADGYDVTFQTGDGHTGTVFVPMARYNVDRVREVITEAAMEADAVGSLTSDK